MNIIPPGYTAHLLGTVSTLGELNTISPFEETIPEGSLMLMRLDFTELPSTESLTSLEQQLTGAGVPLWPGYTNHVYTDGLTTYITWQKGIAWMPIIIGILVLLVLPTLLGGFIWWLTPEPVKEIINTMVMVGIMVLMMSFMTPMLKKEGK